MLEISPIVFYTIKKKQTKLMKMLKSLLDKSVTKSENFIQLSIPYNLLASCPRRTYQAVSQMRQ